jgi:hypothetical protein
MRLLKRCAPHLAATLLLSGCAAPPPSGSIEEAVNAAWERFCNSGYCEGFRGTIVDRTDRTLTVSINGNIRYLTYTVSGERGNYVVQMQPTADRGRARP